MSKKTDRECDVLVVGGGPAGIAASIAAARSGAETALIEQNPAPGGNVFHAKVHTICGLFRNDTNQPELLHDGFPTAFANELVRRNGADAPRKVGDVFVLPIYPDEFCALARSWLDDEPALSTELSTRLQSVERRRNKWQIHTTHTKDGTNTRWRSSLLLDTSGDAVAVKKAGADCLQSPVTELQIPSYIVRISGIPEHYFDGFQKMRIHHHLAEGVKDDQLPKGCESVLLRPGPEPETGYMTLNMPRNCGTKFNPFDASTIRQFEQVARRYAEQIIERLRQQNDEFRDLTIDRHPERIGIRETRRMKGRDIVGREHVLNGATSPSSVAKSAWPIELWEAYETPEFLLPDAPCEIPLGSLVSETYPDLGAAGRCMSATHDALGALRVIGTAMATGEALGFAAAQSTTDRDLSTVHTDDIHEKKRTQFPDDRSNLFDR